MKTSPPRPNEQRKIEQLLLKLATVKPISAKTIPPRENALKTA
jgi:hypothetical protein